MKAKPLTTKELQVIKSIIAEKAGFHLKDYLIRQAFTRSSYSRQFGGGNNENLEFIGDTILGYHVVKKLYEYYGSVHTGDDDCCYIFRACEEELTTLKNSIVSNRALAKIMEGWGLSQYLVVGKSDIDNNICEQDKIKADLLEAILGAIAVQTQWKPEILEKVVSKILPFEELIRNFEAKQPRPVQFSADNAVSTLKELAEHEKCSAPLYEYTGPDILGYNNNGDPIWSCCLRIQDHGIIRTVLAHSKKDAKKYAAYLALCELFELPNEYGPSKRSLLWGFDGKELFCNPSPSF